MPKIELPPRPVLPPSSRIRRLWRAPAIHYSSGVGFPILRLPNNTFRTNDYYRRKLKILRHLRELTDWYFDISSHARQEEHFLRRLSAYTGVNFGFGSEAGHREIIGMTRDLRRLTAGMVLEEEKRIERLLRGWLLRHPQVKFLGSGERMPRRFRREMKVWKGTLRRLKREWERKMEEEGFMERWKRGMGRGTNVEKIQQRNAYKIKRGSIRFRRKLLGKITI